MQNQPDSHRDRELVYMTELIIPAQGLLFPSFCASFIGDATRRYTTSDWNCISIQEGKEAAAKSSITRGQGHYVRSHDKLYHRPGNTFNYSLPSAVHDARYYRRKYITSQTSPRVSWKSKGRNSKDGTLLSRRICPGRRLLTLRANDEEQFARINNCKLIFAYFLDPIVTTYVNH